MAERLPDLGRGTPERAAAIMLCKSMILDLDAEIDHYRDAIATLQHAGYASCGYACVALEEALQGAQVRMLKMGSHLSTIS